MSLVICKECGAQISSEAVACPQCGLPLQSSMSRPSRKLGTRSLSLGILTLLAIAAAGYFAYAERLFQVTLREAVDSTTRHLTSLAQSEDPQRGKSVDRYAVLEMVTRDINLQIDDVRAAAGSKRRQDAAQPVLLYLESARDFIAALDRCDRMIDQMVAVTDEAKQYLSTIRKMSYRELEAAAPTFEPGWKAIGSKMKRVGAAEASADPEGSLELAATRLKEAASGVRTMSPIEAVVPDELLDATVKMTKARMKNILMHELVQLGTEAMGVAMMLEAYK